MPTNASASKSKVSIGTWITAPHPSIVDLVSTFEFDWVCVDLEHSPVSPLELQVALSIIQGRGKKAYVRIKKNEHAEAKFPLDAGADGIIIPMVNSEKEAREAISNCLYPPRGTRGVGLARAHQYGFAFEKHLKENSENLKIILQIEHISAVRDIDAILKLDGLSGIFVGPYDLSGSMGIPGQLDSPKLKEAIQTVAEKTLAAKKLLGIHVIDPNAERFEQYVKLGYNFVAFSTDTFILGQKIKDELSKLKGMSL